MTARALALACGCALVALAPAARAAPCNAPELLGTVPPEGATGVRVDASLQAFYASSADYLGEEVLLAAEGSEPRPVPAAFDRTQGLLTVRPPDGLAAGVTYRVRWPGLRGVDTSNPGIGREVRFTAGEAPDAQAPAWEGLTGIEWDLVRERNTCTDALEERLVFDLTLAEAADDGGRASLTLVVFQTAGPELVEPVQVLARPMPSADAPVRIGLPTSRAVGRICFAALARDLTGKVSASANREVCVDTTAPPFFRGCAYGGRGGGHALAIGWLLAVVVLRALAGGLTGRRRGNELPP